MSCLSLSPDSSVVGEFDSFPLTAAVISVSALVEYVSRDQSVATLQASGAISVVAVASSYVVATILGRMMQLLLTSGRGSLAEHMNANVAS